MTCPKCGSTRIRASKRATWKDALQRIQGRTAFRCQNCHNRFFEAGIEPTGLKPKGSAVKLIRTRTKKKLAKKLVVFSIFAVAFIVFWLFLRYLTTDRAPASDSMLTGVTTLHRQA